MQLQRMLCNYKTIYRKGVPQYNVRYMTECQEEEQGARSKEVKRILPAVRRRLTMLVPGNDF